MLDNRPTAEPFWKRFRKRVEPFWKRFRLVFSFGAAFVAIAAIIAVLTANAWFGIAFFVTAFGAFFLQGLRRIPASPPHKGQLTIFGERIEGKYLDEGWQFFPFYPYWYGVVLVNVERITFTITSKKTRTPDRANSEIPILVTIRPRQESLVNYINSGQKDGVKEQISGKILERIREWAMSVEEGPADWVELNRSQLEAVSVLVKKITGNSLFPIPSYAQEVPTWIWLRFYSKPQPKYDKETTPKKEKYWAETKKKDGAEEEMPWAEVEAVLKKIRGYSLGKQQEFVQELKGRIERLKGKDAVVKFNERLKEHHDGESSIAVKALRVAVDERRKEIRDLRSGNGKIVLDDLGCTLERLNIGDIDVLGKVAEQADLEAKERQERLAEELELQHVLGRVAKLMESPSADPDKPGGLGLTAEQALEIVQTERGKVAKTVSETKLNISPETRAMVEKIVPGLLNQLAPAWKRS